MTLVAGHTLRFEGAPHAVDEDRQVVRIWEGRYGRGLCSCGALSDLLHSTAERKRWHAAHKAVVALEVQATDTAPQPREHESAHDGEDHHQHHLDREHMQRSQNGKQ